MISLELSFGCQQDMKLLEIELEPLALHKACKSIKNYSSSYDEMGPRILCPREVRELPTNVQQPVGSYNELPTL